MNEITIRNLLPKVFQGMEDTIAIKKSEIWQVPSFTFKKGCRICLHTESGGGKSSLLSFIYGNRKDYLGEILFDNKNIRTLNIPDWCNVRKYRIALLPQEMRLFPELTTIENIRLKNSLTNKKSLHEISEMLKVLGIYDKIDVVVSKLSIGQQQRVAIARTLCQPFDFILLDEPVSHLDETNNRTVARLIESEAEKNEAGIITTSVGNHLLLKDAEFIKL